MTTLIREAYLDDANLLADVIRRSFRDAAERFGLTADNCPHHPSNCTAERVTEAFAKNVRFFVLESDGAPIGCVGIERPDAAKCYVRHLAVLPTQRRRGHGSALMNHLMAQADQMGINRIELAQIADDTELRRWYESHGFVLTDVRRFDHLPFDVAFLAKDVTRPMPDA